MEKKGSIESTMFNVLMEIEDNILNFIFKHEIKKTKLY